MNNDMTDNNTDVRDNHFTHGLWADQGNHTHNATYHGSINTSH
jgi:hypothetical protein